MNSLNEHLHLICSDLSRLLVWEVGFVWAGSFVWFFGASTNGDYDDHDDRTRIQRINTDSFLSCLHGRLALFFFAALSVKSVNIHENPIR